MADLPVTLYDLPEKTDLNLWLVGPDGQLRAPKTKSDQLQIFIVEYNWPSGIYYFEAELQKDGVVLERLKSQPVLTVENRDIPFDIPPVKYPLNANFADNVLLLGYNLPSHRIQAADGVSILLYWQALAKMRNSYVMFARLLDTDQQVWGGYDRLPRETYSTILWVPDEVVTDGFILPLEPDTPDGIYNVVLGLYNAEDKSATSLPLMYDGNPSEANSIIIGPVKIGDAPSEATLTSFEPQVTRNDMFGDSPIISLQGYDLAIKADQLALTLYWRSEALPNIGYTRFTHLRDEQGNTIAQSDGLPGGGLYPTQLWDKGEIIADEINITLPQNLAPTAYSLVVGLYDPATGQRLPVPTSATGDDSVLLTTVDLE